MAPPRGNSGEPRQHIPESRRPGSLTGAVGADRAGVVALPRPVDSSADKMAAVASCAKQMEGYRTREDVPSHPGPRALERCGELLKAIQPAKHNQHTAGLPGADGDTGRGRPYPYRDGDSGKLSRCRPEHRSVRRTRAP